MIHNKIKRIIVFLLIVVLAAVLFFPVLNLIGDYLIVPDSLEKVDLITAVSGPEYRIVYAADLYKKGLAKTLFFTGGYSEKNQRYEAAWSEYLATINGVPEEAIQTDDATVISTYQEAVELKKYIDAHPEGNYKVVTVVTDPYHTRRAKWAYEKVFGSQVQIRMAPVPFAQTGYSKKWWTSSKTIKMVSEEYFKLAFYKLRYQVATGSFQKWLSQFDKF
jgi:uncharacterized SAM-binding protein YcdF (DUF218 family)